jgi:hypothetical protein
LEPGAPAGAAIDAASGVFTWTPTALQGPATNTIAVRVTDNGSPNLSAIRTFLVVVLAPPVITVPPTNQVVLAGASAVFAVAATGAAPLSYQWWFNGTNAMAGATNATLIVSNAQPANAGAYQVVVANMGGSATSAVALLALTNHVPTLGGLSNRVLIVGQSLNIMVNATDPDVPPQALTFGLQGAPAGAGINATNGQFTWAPATNQAPSTNVISVWVLDNGVPPLGATNSFVVVVGAPPRFGRGQVVVAGSQIQMTVETLPGKSYQVLYKARLQDAN